MATSSKGECAKRQICCRTATMAALPNVSLTLHQYSGHRLYRAMALCEGERCAAVQPSLA